MDFKEITTRAALAARKQQALTWRLSNGAVVAQYGDSDAPGIFLLSGVHGDERSGPEALLSLLEGPLGSCCFERILVCPVLNDEGWDKGERNWRGLDLNRSFSEQGAPPFVRELMILLQANPPLAVLDLHEDETEQDPYLFRYQDEKGDYLEQMAERLTLRLEPWKMDPEWEGSTEVWARRDLKVPYGFTLEVPPTWSMAARISLNLQAANWCLNRVF